MSGSCDEPIVFHCEGARLVGVVSVPTRVDRAPHIGVLIVVGGPQYRVGSHRQFTHLARTLARGGAACMRFDLRGMGDSEGQARDFQCVSEDIASAVETFLGRVPSIGALVIWGLCDGATASAFYAPGDRRVAGLVLVNPWVRTESGEARALVRKYYLQRLLEAEFWLKLFRGRVPLVSSAGELLRHVTKAFVAPRRAEKERNGLCDPGLPLPERVARCLGGFRGKVLVVLSGNDLTAAEFEDCAGEDKVLGKALHKTDTEWMRVRDANHTFSSGPWKAELADATLTWLERHFGANLVKEVGDVQFLQE